jgi:hypothetical protein
MAAPPSSVPAVLRHHPPRRNLALAVLAALVREVDRQRLLLGAARAPAPLPLGQQPEVWLLEAAVLAQRALGRGPATTRHFFRLNQVSLEVIIVRTRHRCVFQLLPGLQSLLRIFLRLFNSVVDYRR